MLDEPGERALIVEATTRLAEAEGRPPEGWLGPWISHSHVTPDLLAEAGYRYLLDWCMDDQPIWFRCRNDRRILAVPYPQEVNDIPQIVGRKIGGDAFADIIVDHFDEMMELSRERPLVMGVALHAYLVGQPHRLRHLKRALRHIARHRDSIWLTTPAQSPGIARLFPKASSPRSTMRLFSATLATETNTFSPLPTSLENYRESVFFRAGEHPADAPRMCTAPLFVARARARAEGFELIEGSCFAASPAGTTNRADYETMRDEILGQLKAALPVDGILLGLHGAMVAHGYDDVEGDIIERCRAIVGPKCVIGVELDPHCHLTMKRVSNADIIVLYKEFPHTDVVERAEDVLDLVLATLRGKVKPVMSVYDCRQIQSYPTTMQPMRSIVDRIMAMEGKDGILSVSIAHCFPYGDVPEIGTRVLVIADGDKKKADSLATQLGEELVGLRGKTAPQSLDVAAGIAEGVAFNDLPVVVADPSDNAGGGRHRTIRTS